MPEATSLFVPHANLDDAVNHNLVQSEIEGGVFLRDLPSATVLQIQTQNHCYTAVLVNEGSALLSGHPEYCPQPVLVAISGSTWGGSMLKRRYVGCGMHLEFRHPQYQTPIVTSRIKEIRECTVMSQAQVMALAYPPVRSRDIPYKTSPDSPLHSRASAAGAGVPRAGLSSLTAGFGANPR